MLWSHEAARLHQAWDRCGHAVWKPRWHMLNLPGPDRSAFNMATWDQRTPCIEKIAPRDDLQTTVDRVLWQARTYGGYTVTTSDLTPDDRDKLLKELQRDGTRFRHQ